MTLMTCAEDVRALAQPMFQNEEEILERIRAEPCDQNRVVLKLEDLELIAACDRLVAYIATMKVLREIHEQYAERLERDEAALREVLQAKANEEHIEIDSVRRLVLRCEPPLTEARLIEMCRAMEGMDRDQLFGIQLQVFPDEWVPELDNSSAGAAAFLSDLAAALSGPGRGQVLRVLNQPKTASAVRMQQGRPRWLSTLASLLVDQASS